MTSAPQSASCRTDVGPALATVKSMTRMSSSGSFAVMSYCILSPAAPSAASVLGPDPSILPLEPGLGQVLNKTAQASLCIVPMFRNVVMIQRYDTAGVLSGTGQEAVDGKPGSVRFRRLG